VLVDQHAARARRRAPEPLPHRHQNNARTLLYRRAIEIWRGERKVATIKPDV
jgi:hypothetical protein